MNPAWAGQIHSQVRVNSCTPVHECSEDFGNTSTSASLQNSIEVNFSHPNTSISSSINQSNKSPNQSTSACANLESLGASGSGSVDEGSQSSKRSKQRSGVSALFGIGSAKSLLRQVGDESEDEMESGSDSDDVVNVTRYGSINGNSVLRERRRSQSSTVGPGMEMSSPTLDKMRRRLRYFFMNPLEKWETKRQFPYKLTIQLVKIFFVTFQLCLFASYRYASVNYTWDNKITFSHLFIKDWDTSREITSYPPTTGPLAVYRKKDFYNYLDFTIDAYAHVEDLAIGPYFYPTPNNTIAPMKFCVERYTNGVIFGFNESYTFDSKTENLCIEIPSAALSNSTEQFSSESFLTSKNFTISFDSLLEANLSFMLKTVRFRDLGPFKSPDCFQFDIDILFNNRDHDGQALVTLEATPTRLKCKGDADYIADNRLERVGRSGVNYMVIGMCTLSLVLCCRAIYRAQFLKAETVSFFKRYFNQDLTVQDRLEFLNFWYLLIILNDILIIIGSAIKEQIENKELTGEAWNICSLLLGIGNLLVWFGVLRYLGFFRTYNVLILTLKRASPNVMRFLICAVLIYAGFTFCGWLILGPYHIKFSTLSTTSECLFALINGDDMFATFAGMSSKSSLLWWFCRLYLYTFISLFIYVVLSLFIALIMDAYETIKLYYQEGFPRSALHEFITGSDTVDHPPPSPPYSINCCHHIHPHSLSRQSSTAELGRKTSTAGGILDTIVETLCGCNSPSPNKTPHSPTETEPLLGA